MTINSNIADALNSINASADLYSTLVEGYLACRPALLESASSKLYHFCNFSALKKIFREHRMPVSFAEEKYNGKGIGAISFSRTASIREGFPVLFHSDEWCRGDDWCIIRINFNGDALNLINRFKQGGHYHGIKVKPFDWVHHEYGESARDEFAEGLKKDTPADAKVDTGKTWMLYSNGSCESSVPVGPDRGLRVCGFSKYISPDSTAHPYSQAEDRLYTTAKYIPNIEKYVDSVDIILEQHNFNSANYDDRKCLRNMLIHNDFLCRKARVCLSRYDLEHHKVLMNAIQLLTAPGEERGENYYMKESAEYW